MTPFRTEIRGLNDRDQVMLTALLAALHARADVQWAPDDDKARIVHFIDVESPVGHRYWRSLDEKDRRDASIALAYKTPTHIDAQSRWITKPIRARALQDALLEILGSSRQEAISATETISNTPVSPIQPRRAALLQRLEAFRGASR